MSDWGSNLVSALGFEPAEYKLARENLLPLILALKNANRNGSRLNIYAVGHSLGGGLAQQAGYLSKDIDEVFTFNMSPVTNWSYLRMKGKVGNAHPIIHRIYHGGEFLEQARFVSTSFTQARYGRHDIELQFEPRSEFSGHSMNIIACHFAALILARRGGVEADHHYSLEFINSTVLGSKSEGNVETDVICPIAEFARTETNN